MKFLQRLFGRNESTKLQTPSPDIQEKELIKDYEEFIEKREELKREYLVWQNEFNRIIELRQKAQKLEKEKKLEEAISYYFKSIIIGEKSEKLKINNYAFDIERAIILLSKTKRTLELKKFLEEKIGLYPDFQDTKKWTIRLSKLNTKRSSEVKSISPFDIDEVRPGKITIGQKINGFKLKMPEFNFYYDLPENAETLSYDSKVTFEHFRVLGELREEFENIKNFAEIAETEGNYKKAIEAYKKMITEDYEGPEPYERLIIIFAKLKWKNEEKKIIEQAISFFTSLKDKQLKYVLSLAKKYNMTEKALEYINQDKKIFYYGGAFELYNPQTSRLTKWRKRLEKI